MKKQKILTIVFCVIFTFGFLFIDGKAQEQKALFFDGINDFIDCPHIELDNFKSFTIEVWVRNWSGYILCQGAVGDPENSVWLSTVSGDFDGCGWEADKGDPNYAINVDTPILNKWMHIALVFDGKYQYVFSNGNLTKMQETPKPGPLDKTRNFIIGAETRSNPKYDWQYGSGFLKSIRISQNARYKKNFTPNSDLKPDSETVLLYTLNSVKNMKLLDLSKNELHGSMRGVRIIGTDEIKSATISGFAKDQKGMVLSDVFVDLYQGENFITTDRTNVNGGFNFIVNRPTDAYRIEAYKDELLKLQPDIQLSEDEHLKVDLTLITSSYEKFEWTKYFIGQWIHESVIDDNQKTTTNASFKWILNRNIMDYSFITKVDNKIINHQKGMVGWDPVKNRLEEWNWDLLGLHSEGAIQLKENSKLIRKYSTITSRGEKEEAISILWFTNTNTFYFQNARIDDNGDVQPIGEALKFNRVIP